MPNLAISLHATTEEQRDRLVPINRKYGLERSARRLPPFPAQAAQRITFEYVLLDEVNDTPRRRAPAGQAAERDQGEGQPAAAERSGRAFRSSGRQTIASTASRRSWPITASRCRCASPAAATSAPPAVS